MSDLLPATAQSSPLAQEDPNIDSLGELRAHEFAFRAGLLLGAGLFLELGLGFPWERSLLGFVGGVLLATLAVYTMVRRWRVLGDWRRRTQQVLHVGFAAVLCFATASALDPRPTVDLLPGSLQPPARVVAAALENLPGLGLLGDLVTGFVGFLFLLLLLLILLLGGRGRTGILIAAGLTFGVCIGFHPSVEAAAGFLFLLSFVYTQWEIPVLVPDRLRPHLKPAQFTYLRDLVTTGSLSAGETKAYLRNRPDLLDQLLDCHLVTYDSARREILPAPRLLGLDPNAPTSPQTPTGIRLLWFAVGLAYFIIPDIIPGPVDDLVIMALCALSGMDAFSALSRRPGRRMLR